MNNNYLHRSLADEILEKYKIKKPPIPISKIAQEETGFELLITKFFENRVTGYIDTENLSILVNKMDHYYRQRFAIAYLLGSLLLNEKEVMEQKKEAITYFKAKTCDTAIEINAYAFALGLLMPPFLLENYYDKSVREIANVFMVPMDIIKEIKDSIERHMAIHRSKFKTWMTEEFQTAFCKTVLHLYKHRQ